MSTRNNFNCVNCGACDETEHLLVCIQYTANTARVANLTMTTKPQRRGNYGGSIKHHEPGLKPPHRYFVDTVQSLLALVSLPLFVEDVEEKTPRWLVRD